MTAETPILQIQNLCKYFPVGHSILPWRAEKLVHAVDGVSFELNKAEVLALVGESGCGKSTLILTLLGLEKATHGKIIFENKDVTHATGAALKALRRNIQMIFQDPFSSLNPRMTIFDIVGEPLLVNGVNNADERRDRVAELMQMVGLSAVAHCAYVLAAQTALSHNPLLFNDQGSLRRFKLLLA